MRILQLVTKPQRRGAEIFAYDLSRQFETMGHTSKTIYLYRYAGEDRLPLHGPDAALDGSETHFLERTLGFNPRLLYRVAREIGRFKPAVVQVNGSRTVKYGAAAKRLSNSRGRWKLVYRNIGMPSDWHRGEETVLAYRFMIMPRMDGVIGVSSVSLTDARALYKLNGPSGVILNGINPIRIQVDETREAIRARYGISPDTVILLFLGYLDETKRPDRFVRAVAAAADEVPEVRGWIVGDGPLADETRRLAEQLRVQDRVRFFGQQERVGEFLKAADVFVLTSETEGVPATILEASYESLPIVATNVGGLAECVEDGETGLLVPEGDAAALNQAILSLVLDPAKRAAMGVKARQKALEEFTIDRIAEKYLGFYRGLFNDSDE